MSANGVEKSWSLRSDKVLVVCIALEFHTLCCLVICRVELLMIISVWCMSLVVAACLCCFQLMRVVCAARSEQQMQMSVLRLCLFIRWGSGWRVFWI